MQRRREPRQAVNLGARLKTDAGDTEIQILNVSSYGFMARCANPPCRGTYIEVRLGPSAIVGRVAWSSTDRFGASTRDRIALDGAIAGRDQSGANNRLKPGMRLTYQPRYDLAEQAAASARFARLFDFAVLAGAVAIFAMLVAGLAAQAMEEPFGRVHAAFKHGQR